MCSEDRGSCGRGDRGSSRELCPAAPGPRPPPSLCPSPGERTREGSTVQGEAAPGKAGFNPNLPIYQVHVRGAVSDVTKPQGWAARAPCCNRHGAQ